jgi:hypothetical protein
MCPYASVYDSSFLMFIWDLVCILLGLDTVTIDPECIGFNAFKIAKYQVCDCDSGWRWLSNVGKKYKWWTHEWLFQITYLIYFSKGHNVLNYYCFESRSFLWANVTYKFNALFGRGCQRRRKECRELLRTPVQRERWKLGHSNLYIIGKTLLNL